MAKLGQVGKVSLTISDPDGNAISTARVDFSRDGKAEKFIPAYPDENGLIELSLPLGEWKLSTKDNGREKVDSKIIVKKEETNKKTISMSAQSGIDFAITKEDGSPTPCKHKLLASRELPVLSWDRLTGLMDASISIILKTVSFQSVWLRGNTES